MLERIPMSAVILAGGKSSRMGQDKALLRFGEETMMEYLVRILQPLFDETLIVVDQVGKVSGLNLRNATVCEDLVENRGPLAGVYTGLCYASCKFCCVLTCDMPFVDGDLIRELAEFSEDHVDAVCVEDFEGCLQPFPGIYLRTRRSLMRQLLDQGESSVRQFLEFTIVKRLILQPERIRVLTNMNFIEDYYRVLKEKNGCVK